MSQKITCTGLGECIEQDENGEDQLDPNCPHKCQFIECPNFPVCRRKHAAIYLGSHGGYCLPCQLVVGGLSRCHF